MLCKPARSVWTEIRQTCIRAVINFCLHNKAERCRCLCKVLHASHVITDPSMPHQQCAAPLAWACPAEKDQKEARQSKKQPRQKGLVPHTPATDDGCAKIVIISFVTNSHMHAAVQS